MSVLHGQVREQVKKRKVWGVAPPPPNLFKRKAKWTTLIIIDSQAVQNTCNVSVESKGFCFYKATNGIKRHLAVDTLGFPSSRTVRAQIFPMMRGCHSMLTHNINYFRAKQVNIPKIAILVDHGYHPEHLTQELEQVYPQAIKKIKFELSTKPSKQEKTAQGKSGFVPAVARWGKRAF